MVISDSKIKDLKVIELNKFDDERGYFARTYCQKEFDKYGMCKNFPQCNISFNKKKGTLRGMHFQKEPFAEPKLVRCERGNIFDVAIDLRKKSPTFKQWFGIELSAENSKALYIPEGFAHGFITLRDNSTVFYQMGEFYNPEASQGVRWNDKSFNIKWPITPIVISENDNSYNDFK